MSGSQPTFANHLAVEDDERMSNNGSVNKACHDAMDLLQHIFQMDKPAARWCGSSLQVCTPTAISQAVVSAAGSGIKPLGRIEAGPD